MSRSPSIRRRCPSRASNVLLVIWNRASSGEHLEADFGIFSSSTSISKSSSSSSALSSISSSVRASGLPTAQGRTKALGGACGIGRTGSFARAVYGVGRWELTRAPGGDRRRSGVPPEDTRPWRMSAMEKGVRGLFGFLGGWICTKASRWRDSYRGPGRCRPPGEVVLPTGIGLSPRRDLRWWWTRDIIQEFCFLTAVDSFEVDFLSKVIISFSGGVRLGASFNHKWMLWWGCDQRRVFFSIWGTLIAVWLSDQSQDPMGAMSNQGPIYAKQQIQKFIPKSWFFFHKKSLFFFQVRSWKQAKLSECCIHVESKTHSPGSFSTPFENPFEVTPPLSKVGRQLNPEKFRRLRLQDRLYLPVPFAAACVISNYIQNIQSHLPWHLRAMITAIKMWYTLVCCSS